jgi:dihydroorotate dehydrogenase
VLRRLLAAGYGVLFRAVLLRLDPETAHALAMAVIRGIGAVPPLATALRRLATRRGSEVRALGLDFPTPFGLAAGFDKNAVGVAGLGALGFGHVEIGTVTHLPQSGNPKPRLFRLPADGALINRMGFNNQGAEAVARRLRRRPPGALPIVGVNIGKSRAVDVDDAVADYVASTRLLAPVADYLAVNVSSPNTPGLRGLQDLDRLEPLLAAVRDAAGSVPLLVKIAPDLTDEAVRDIGALVLRLGLAGVIATNTTVERTGLRTPAAEVERMGAGGLSGRPVAARSLEVLGLLRDVLPPETAVISVGGVLTRRDVQARLHAGATLVQGYTGFLYRGPTWAADLA